MLLKLESTMSTTNPLTHYVIEAQKILLAAAARGGDRHEAVERLANVLCSPAANRALAHADDKLVQLQASLDATKESCDMVVVAGNEVCEDLVREKALTQQLVAALKLQADDHQRFLPHHAELCETCKATSAALAAAGAA
jgi:hypothetical protein